MAMIQTVCGSIRPEDLGLTLSHEHLLVDVRPYWLGEPKELGKRQLYSQPVALQNRAEVVYNACAFLDNLIVDDVDNAAAEVNAFLGYGGSSIVDVTPDSLGRDPAALRYISRTTGAHIIMSAGRYAELTLTEAQKAMGPDDVARAIEQEFIEGADGTGIKPGIIGEAAVNYITSQVELNGLRGCARAQRRVGCAISVHPVLWETHALDLFEVLDEEGVDPSRVIFCHNDHTVDKWEYQDAIAKKGAYVEFDTFGSEFMPDEPATGRWFPSDGERIRAVKKQIELGNEDRILISHDMCFKICYTRWGGWGYAHIPKNIIPRMRLAGISDEQIHKITVENPRRVLAF
jgi:phosphotriesterase-related protein